jgi:cytochrome c biogenesis protein CcmG/thiol:disulfide interchange protein DsbE
MARIPLLVLIPPVAFAALAGLFAAGMMRDDGQELPSALVGQVAPAFPETPLPGHAPPAPGTLADGEVKLVNFFASWCAPCRVEHPVLTDLAEQGLPVYGIAYKDDPARTAAFLEELGNPYTGIAQDADGRMAPDWGLYGVPETFVLAGDGTVIDRMPFPLTPELVATRLRAALAEAGAHGG